MKNTVKSARILGAISLLFLSGCMSMNSRAELQEIGSIEGTGREQTALERELSNNGQAVVVWEEPMVDVVDVPPGLDPEGHYYRPAHKSIVEIRQGRWQYYDRSKK